MNKEKKIQKTITESSSDGKNERNQAEKREGEREKENKQFRVIIS